MSRWIVAVALAATVFGISDPAFAQHLCGLDERATDVMIPDESEGERDAGLGDPLKKRGFELVPRLSRNLVARGGVVERVVEPDRNDSSIVQKRQRLSRP